MKSKATALMNRVVTGSYSTGTLLAGERDGLMPQAMYGGMLREGTLQSPEAMYASTQSAQFAAFYSFFSTTFSIFTDLSGTARANIIELAVSLVNDIVNITAANIINSANTGNLAIDYCQGSASLSFVCPNYSPSTIGGTGFGRNPSVIKVGVIGCFDSQAIRNLATLSKPKNLAAGIRLVNKLISLTQAAARNQSVAAVEVPDSIDEDFIFGGDLLYFDNGWPRVNQGRLPCVGLVIVINLETGSFGAANVNMLGSCG
jgi:hypothetical protein